MGDFIILESISFFITLLVSSFFFNRVITNFLYSSLFTTPVSLQTPDLGISASFKLNTLKIPLNFYILKYFNSHLGCSYKFVSINISAFRDLKKLSATALFQQIIPFIT